MANVRTLSRSFGAGELSPEFYGRIDDAKYQTGTALCRNFIVTPQGQMKNASGTKFVRKAKGKCRLLRFQYSAEQSFCVEMGAGYFRWHTQGATLLAPAATAWSNATNYTLGNLASRLGVIYYCILAHINHQPPNATYWYPLPSDAYEIPHNYSTGDLVDVGYVQSEDVMTITHRDHPVRELRRYGATDWRLVNADFGIPLAAPTGLAVTEHLSPDHSGTSNTLNRYAVTAAGTPLAQESARSGSVSGFNNLLEPAAYNQLDWNPVAGATRYYVYKESGGVFGFIGQTADVTLRDSNITPDTSKTPPIDYNPFSGAGNYPAAPGYFQQRRLFAGSYLNPQGFDMSKTGTEGNFSYSLPLRDDDSISHKLKGRLRQEIRHIVPIGGLVMLTDEAAWLVTAPDGGAVTPVSIAADAKAYKGASRTLPVTINRNVVYVESKKNRIRSIGYSQEGGGFVTAEASLRAYHLFKGGAVVDMAYQDDENSCVWMVDGASGRLIGFTYVPEEEVGAFHRHDTRGGAYESVCCVTEGDEQALYVSVLRTIGGVGAGRFVERFVSRDFAAQEDCFFVHCGLTYDGAPAATISGLGHLEGEEVAILADGAVHPRRTVAGGAIALDYAASVVHVGVPIEAEAQTLPAAFEIQGGGTGRPKNVNKAWIRINDSGGFKVGPSLSELRDAAIEVGGEIVAPRPLASGEAQIELTQGWSDGGQAWIAQYDPLPLNILSLSLEVSVGG